MTSGARVHSGFPEPTAVTEQLVFEVNKLKRHSTVYDAVAGRISAFGFIQSTPLIASSRDTASSSSSAVPPEAVLFRRKNAPPRYEETDPYFASDSLSPHVLPDSDLLKALHCYTSDFYSRVTADGGIGDWRSMDETALLALGILMEEICRNALGDTGDMVFTEGELEQTNSNRDSSLEATKFASVGAKDTTGTRSRKRRRLDPAASP